MALVDHNYCFTYSDTESSLYPMDVSSKTVWSTIQLLSHGCFTVVDEAPLVKYFMKPNLGMHLTCDEKFWTVDYQEENKDSEILLGF